MRMLLIPIRRSARTLCRDPRVAASPRVIYKVRVGRATALLRRPRLALDAPGPGRFNTRPRCGPHLPHDRSNPPGQVAQLVEQGTENPRVGGSIPSLATTEIRYLRRFYELQFCLV